MGLLRDIKSFFKQQTSSSDLPEPDCSSATSAEATPGTALPKCHATPLKLPPVRSATFGSPSSSPGRPQGASSPNPRTSPKPGCPPPGASASNPRMCPSPLSLASHTNQGSGGAPSPPVRPVPPSPSASKGSMGGAAMGLMGVASFSRRLTRQRSVPLILDTAGGAGAQNMAQLGSSKPGVDQGTLRQERKAEVLARLRSTGNEKKESLKHLLNLDQYDFVSDVNVSAARQLASMPSLHGLNTSSRKDLKSERASSDADFSALSTTGGIFSIVSAMADPDEQELDTEEFEDFIADGGTQAEDSNVLAVSTRLPMAMRRSRWALGDYKLLKKLHKGYASEVFQAKCRITGEMVALKVYGLAGQCDLQRVQLYREIRVHSRLQHHNVVQFYSSFLEGDNVVIVQEYCEGGDLLKVLYKCGGRLMERQAVNVVLQPFLQALQYLHLQGIVHRDIKPENVLFTEDKVLKVADFGLAIDLNEERANTRAGTLDYMAPEVLRCPTKQTPDENKGDAMSAHYHAGVDAWGLGAFAYELLTGVAPFKASEMMETARNIIHAEVQFPNSMSDHACDFISQALSKHPGDRPTVIEMLRHPWITMLRRRASVVTPNVSRIARTSLESAYQRMSPLADTQGRRESHVDKLRSEGRGLRPERSAPTGRSSLDREAFPR